MSKVEFVSAKQLQNYIKDYRKLKERTFSLSVHIARSRIEKHTDDIIESFRKGILVLQPEQYKDFAYFIETFGCGNTEECLDLLQQKADFDVREFLMQDRRSTWQKLWDKFNKKEIQYLSARKLNRRVKKYISLRHKMEQKPWLNIEGEQMTNEADAYIKLYLEGKINIKPEDAVAFKRFIKVMEYPIFKGSEGELALQKLQKEHGDILEQSKHEVKTDKVPLFIRFNDYIQTKSTAIKKHFVKNQKWYGRAVAGIVGLVTVGALWNGLKGNSDKEENIELTNQAKTEVKAPKAETKASDEKLIHFSFVSNEYKGIDLKTLMETAPKKEVKAAQTTVAKESNAQKAKVSEAKPAKETKAKTIKTTKVNNVTLETNANDSVKLARSNHHKVVLAMRLGATKSEGMINYIQDKMKKGLITMPANLGAEDFVYAMEMYRGYGVESSLRDAFDNTQKLSAEQNKKVVEDIIAAGETGLGVKKMAAEMNGGKLNHKSVYDRASVKFKKQHNKNLQQLFKAKKRAAKVA